MQAQSFTAVPLLANANRQRSQVQEAQSQTGTHALKASLSDAAASVPMYGLPHGSYRELSPHMLKYDSEHYGRLAIMPWLSTLRHNWHPAKIGTIYVSLRADGTYVVIDGQHRVTVAREKNMQTVPCWVYEGLTLEQEAALYAAFGQTKTQTALQIFRARLVAGDPTAKHVLQQVEDAGYTINFANNMTRGRYVRNVVMLEDLYQRFGASHLFKVLVLTREMFPDEPRATKDYVFRAVSALILNYVDMDRTRMISRARDEGFLRLSGLGRSIALTTEKSLWIGFGQALVQAYNKKISVRRALPEWAEVVPARTLSPGGVKRILEGQVRSTEVRRARRNAVFTQDEVDGAPD